MATPAHIDSLRDRAGSLKAPELLEWLTGTFGDRVAFATSLGPEDQVLTDMLASRAPAMKVFTLDTGRLFPETYDLLDRTSTRYGVDIHGYFPDAADVEKLVRSGGVNSFRQSVEARKRCCAVRKVAPLRRALADLDVWVCGLRAEQSQTRQDLSAVEWDEANGLIKVSPLFDWTESDVWRYIREHDVPDNPLHDEGFRSIGCQPCTRATLPGEDERAGRWWWESLEHKECGLHRRGGDRR
ncbi:MAG: phosphoadenylyl-sulfate reductase [Coriobacteriales bacterium]|nr:phosphoadenylyl-sulfate reductase [Coriobacteriales bacterium]